MIGSSKFAVVVLEMNVDIKSPITVAITKITSGNNSAKGILVTRVSLSPVDSRPSPRAIPPEINHKTSQLKFLRSCFTITPLTRKTATGIIATT